MFKFALKSLILAIAFSSWGGGASAQDQYAIAMKSMTEMGKKFDRGLIILQAEIRALESGSSTDQAIRSALEVYFVQVQLLRLGFLVGKADGVIGPKTRKALRKYAETKGIGPDFYDVFIQMSHQFSAKRSLLDDGEIPSEVREAVSKLFKDPYSTVFSDVSERVLTGGVKIYCGKVNAKNSYGA